MALSNEDRTWLDTKFTSVQEEIGRVHSRITEHALDDERRMGTIAATLAAPCRDVTAHIEEKHNPLKLWSILGAVVGVATALASAIAWAISKVK